MEVEAPTSLSGVDKLAKGEKLNNLVRYLKFWMTELNQLLMLDIDGTLDVDGISESVGDATTHVMCI